MRILRLLAVVASQFFASTPPIVDSNGQQIPMQLHRRKSHDPMPVING
jgi:hypothetical protein